MKNCDVAIDFSHADAIEGICRAALQFRKPLIIGTTGHSPAQRQVIDQTAQLVPIVFASNFSIGVNALFALAHNAVKILGGEFGREIIESHQRMKKDAPKRTAKTSEGIMKKEHK